MADSATQDRNYQETDLGKYRHIQVYTRLDDQKRPVQIDAIDVDEEAIKEIANILHEQGFGVMRQRNPRAGKVYHRLIATWAGEGEPPEKPLKNAPGHMRQRYW